MFDFKQFSSRLTNKLSPLDNYREILILIFIFIVSILIRVIGLRHGFPLLTHPDEGVILGPIIQMTTNRTLNPGTFNRPNQILYLLNFFYLNIVSYLKYGESYASAFPKNILGFYYAARFLVILMGSLIPVVAYKIGKEFKPNFSIPAAIIFMFFPSYVLHSLYITPDIPITLFTLVVIYLTIRYLKEKEQNYLIFATFFAAINTAEKYPGLISFGIVILGIIIVHFEERQQDKSFQWFTVLKKSLMFAGIYLVGIVMVAPYLLIEYQEVIEALIRESRSTHLGADGLSWGGNLLFYIRSFISWSNIFAWLFIIFGIIALIKFRNNYSIVLFYGAAYWIILSRLSLHWERWALPMYITPLFLIAIGITFFYNLMINHHKAKILIVLILFFFMEQIVAGLHVSINMNFTDTRSKALDYAQDHGITPDNSIYEGYTPFLPHGPKWIFDDFHDEDKDYDYVILSSSMYGRFESEPDRYVYETYSYKFVRDNHILLMAISPDQKSISFFDKFDDIMYYLKMQFQHTAENRYRGPTIEIYQVVN